MNLRQEPIHKPKSGCTEASSTKSLTLVLGAQEATLVRHVICYMSQLKPPHQLMNSV